MKPAFVLLFTLAAWPQAPALPEFEAVSVKPHGAVSARPALKVEPSRVTFENMSLSSLICFSYGLRDYQLVRPAWLDDARFDVAAVAGSPQSTERAAADVPAGACLAIQTCYAS